jgi:hypothetical protein
MKGYTFKLGAEGARSAWVTKILGNPMTFTYSTLQYVALHGDKYGLLHMDNEEDGSFEDPNDWRDYTIICCYPGMVKARYPETNVLGDWNEPTIVVLTSDSIAVMPESEYEKLEH